MIEKEIKAIISKDEYERIKHLFHWDKQINQVNYYYGNSIESTSMEITIRVRKIENNIYLQVKIPIEYNKALHIKKEFEEKIDFVPNYITKEQLYNLTGQVDYDVKLIGKLSTERYIHSQNNIEICLDKNNYFNKEDYEIEIEYKDEYPQNCIDILKKNNIDFNIHTDGKCIRFMKEYESMKGREK